MLGFSGGQGAWCAGVVSRVGRLPPVFWYWPLAPGAGWFPACCNPAGLWRVASPAFQVPWGIVDVGCGVGGGGQPDSRCVASLRRLPRVLAVVEGPHIWLSVGEWWGSVPPGGLMLGCRSVALCYMVGRSGLVVRWGRLRYGGPRLCVGHWWAWGLRRLAREAGSTVLLESVGRVAQLPGFCACGCRCLQVGVGCLCAPQGCRVTLFCGAGLFPSGSCVGVALQAPGFSWG